MLSARPISLNADVDVQQQHAILNTKTPGRKALKGRNALQENVLHNGAKTVLTKKNVLQTPFPAHGKKPLVAVSVTRPLMDKTPFPNRVAGGSKPGNAGKTPGLKLSKLALLAPEPGQESTSPDAAPLLRPSSLRKSLRGRLSQNFKTPLTKGNYWDVSPGDAEGIGGGLAEQTQQQTESVPTEEDDEIEYMPPKTIDRPYEPPFDMPDYKTLGTTLFQLGHSGLVDNTADLFYATDIEQQIDVKTLLADTGFTLEGTSKIDSLDLPELDDDSPFAKKPTPAKPTPAKPTPAPSALYKSAIPLARGSSTRAAPARAQAPPSRPATAIPQSRSASRTTTSQPSGDVAVAPGQTRTSALRAAKAAAASNANANTTPNPVRPATSAGTRSVSRPAVLKKPSSSATTTGAVIGAVRLPSGRATGAATSASIPVGSRPRAATMTGRTKLGTATASGSAAGKSKVPDDPLAAMFEREHAAGGGGSGEDDFQFAV